MYPKPPHQQWYYPMSSPSNNNRGNNNWHPPYYNWNYSNWNNYYQGDFNQQHYHHNLILKDYGSHPLIINLKEATKQNNTFRTALWTGHHLQLTLMNIDVGEDIGLEIHPADDQFLRIEEGEGLIQMGRSKEKIDFQDRVYDDYAIFIPAGTWHNVINTGHTPLKLYSIYAPPHHPYGTIHETKAIALAAEENNHE